MVGHSHYLPTKGNPVPLASLWSHSHYLPIHSHFLADPTRPARKQGFEVEIREAWRVLRRSGLNHRRLIVVK
jgi:hypothetical protein